MASGDFWNNQESAQKVIQEANTLKSWINPFTAAKQTLADVEALYDEAKELEDEDLLQDLLQELKRVEQTVESLELKKMLSGELDGHDCFITINSGAGGTESCDWALMLSRMYQRWATSKGWKVEVVDTVDGDVAGIKSMTFKVCGDNAFGYAKGEKGVHRLVRISPFDSNARRHTSFASVDVTPEITDEVEVDIRMEDIRVDTYRASGAGGQHVNKTDSAVRMTHMPTGIIVSCQSQRSQIQNRETCMKMLKSKLYEKEIADREASLQKIKGEKQENAWGSQIRNYVFQPYTLVKDARTGYEVGNVQAMMDGELLDDFIAAYLKASK
jgi:peptide chain release factor 2